MYVDGEAKAAAGAVAPHTEYVYLRFIFLFLFYCGVLPFSFCALLARICLIKWIAVSHPAKLFSPPTQTHR